MAGLIRSVWFRNWRIAVPVCSNLQPKRHVRALRRNPVRVFFPDNQERAQEAQRPPQLRVPSPRRQPLKHSNGDRGPKKAGADQQERSPKKAAGNQLERSPKKAAGNQLERSPKKTAGNQLERSPKKTAGNQLERSPKKAAGNQLERIREKEGEDQPERSPEKEGEDQPERSPKKEGEDLLDASELRYYRAKDGDPKLSKVITLAKSKNFRDRHGQVLLEGRRLMLDALDAGAILQTLYFSSVDQLKELPTEKVKKANLIKVKFQDIKLWSDVVAPQGIMGIFRKPDHGRIKYPELQLKNRLPLTVICDNIRDPGNLGTILRCAAGAGCDKVLLTKGCVDAWEPKVIRAGMGAHFRLPVISLEWETISNYLSEDTKVFVADNFWQHISDENQCSSGKAIDYGWISNDPRRVNYIEGADYYSSGDEGDDMPGDIPNISVQAYYERWAGGPTAVVIGGETHGLSIESMLLAEKSGGRRLYIPVVSGVESLNSAMAASIILFEGRLQLQLKRS